MAIDQNINTLEKQKFREADIAGQVKVAASIEQDPGNPIPVSSYQTPELPSGYQAVLYYDSISAIASGVLTTLSSKTISDDSLMIDKISVGGSNKAEYSVLINSSIVGKKRTYYTSLNTTFDLGGYVANTGDTIEVKVIHDRPDAGDFECNITGIIKL